MLDAVSLDQLRTLIAAVDEGSFSAASRKLLRAQSVVSETISKLEEQIGVQLFDRAGRYPKLTAAGSAVLGDARSIIAGVDLLKARAKGMSDGLEPELSVVIDVFYPIDAITQVAKEFRQNYPGVALRIYVEALGGAIKPVLDGRCSIGVIGSLPVIPDTLAYERLPGIAFLMVAARDHALSSYRGKIPKAVLGKHTQIVLTDRSELSSGREFGVMSAATWRLAELPIEDVPPDGLMLPMSAVWQTKSPPGPAGRWFVDRLKQFPVDTGKVPKPPVSRKKAGRSAKA